MHENDIAEHALGKKRRMRVVGRGLGASWKMLVLYLATSSLILQSERTICTISRYGVTYHTPKCYKIKDAGRVFRGKREL